jgi:hypothetical protein
VLIDWDPVIMLVGTCSRPPTVSVVKLVCCEWLKFACASFEAIVPIGDSIVIVSLLHLCMSDSKQKWNNLCKNNQNNESDKNPCRLERTWVAVDLVMSYLHAESIGGTVV